jgi:hypothetical protein
MSAREFARWIYWIARWECPEDVGFSFFAEREPNRRLIVTLEYEGNRAQIEVEAGTPVRQVHDDLDEFLGRLVVATVRRELARSCRRRQAYEGRPTAN